MLRVTKTESGMVKGFPGTDARITVFKGIPFAAPTCGDNRWRAPQPPKSWAGLPITLVAAALTSMTFMGFTGIADKLFG